MFITPPACKPEQRNPPNVDSKLQSGANVVSKTSAAGRQFAGSTSCRECHERFFRLWDTSFHGQSLRPYTEEFAAESLIFDSSEIQIGDTVFSASETGNFLEIRGNSKSSWPIRYVLGGKNIYYFITETDGGKLQILPLGYDVHKQEWFDRIHSDVPHHSGVSQDTAADWKDRIYTFNTSCHDCHVSGLTKFYDVASDTYRIHWRESGIDCETCHGPASEHNTVCKEASDGSPPEDLRIIRGGRSFTASQNNDSCGRCHAKLIPLGTPFTPGDNYFDHFDLVLLDHSDYYPDGRDRGENYTFTSWLRSRCVRQGKLDCLHCHTSSGRYRHKADPTANCSPCHNEKIQRLSAHSHHRSDSPGAPTCINCHMPVTQFARIPRSDHSMLPPSPALSLKFGSPNACNICHTNRDATWAAHNVTRWFGRARTDRNLVRATLIDDARKQNWRSLQMILAHLRDETQDVIFRSSLIRLLRPCQDDTIAPALVSLLSDKLPLVRAAAAYSLAGRTAEHVRSSLLAAVCDPIRLVRIYAFESLSSLPGFSMMSDATDDVRRAREEFVRFLGAKSDDPAAHLRLGNFYMDEHRYELAVASFQNAVKLAPQSPAILVNLALAIRGAGNPAESEKILLEALSLAPENDVAHLNLAMLYGEMNQMTKASAHFKAAFQHNPGNAQAAFNICVMNAEKDWKSTRQICQRANELEPDNFRYAYTLAYYFYFHELNGQAEAVLKSYLERIELSGEKQLADTELDALNRLLVQVRVK